MFKVEKGKLAVTDIYKCSICKLCTEACDAGAITVDTEDETFIFTVETDGSYSAHDIIVSAMKSIEGQGRPAQRDHGRILNGLNRSRSLRGGRITLLFSIFNQARSSWIFTVRASVADN